MGFIKETIKIDNKNTICQKCGVTFTNKSTNSINVCDFCYIELKNIFRKRIIAYGEEIEVECDGLCNLSNGDRETFEGGDGFSNIHSSTFPTKWCFRQCDRCNEIVKNK